MQIDELLAAVVGEQMRGENEMLHPKVERDSQYEIHCEANREDDL